MKLEKIEKLEREWVPRAVIHNISLEGNQAFFANNIMNHNTGVFGPFKRRIFPKSKKALAWGRDLGGGRKEFVFRSVAGMRPSPFIRPVFHQRLVVLLVEALNEAFKDVVLK